MGARGPGLGTHDNETLIPELRLGGRASASSEDPCFEDARRRRPPREPRCAGWASHRRFLLLIAPPRSEAKDFPS